MSKTQSKSQRNGSAIQQVAGNGLLDRRALLGRGVMLAGAMGAGVAGFTGLPKLGESGDWAELILRSIWSAGRTTLSQ